MNIVPSSAIALFALAGAASAGVLAPLALTPGTQQVFGVVDGVFDGAGFEASEGYASGTINNQNGWTGFVNAGANAASTVQPSGGNPGQALRLTKNTLSSQGSLLGGFSPVFANPTRRTMQVDVRIDDNGGANYFFAGASVSNPAPGQSNALLFVVNFDYRGTIYVGQNTAGALTYADTGIAWLQNTWQTVSVELTQSGITYRYNGQSFSSGFFNTNLGASALLEQAILYSDNYQDSGLGSFSGSPNPAAGYFDNLALIPAPPTALLALALAAPRRRR